MKTLKFFITFLIIFQAIATIKYEKYFLYHKEKRVPIPITKYKKILINDLCLKKIEDCVAYKTYIKKSKKIKLKQNNLSTIAAAYCKYVKGVPLILKDNKYNSAGFCVFKDKTIINSWDLYNNYLDKISNN